MKAEYKDDMFIVINRKHLDEMNNTGSYYAKKAIHNFLYSLGDLKMSYEDIFSTKLDQKYYVCNQDEEYSHEVLRIILEGESEKHQ